MVDGVLSAQAQSASGVGKSERSSARGPVQPVRATTATGQRAFGESFAEATGSFTAPSNDQAPVGNGLLSTGVQVLLAETRSQEAAAPFTPASNVGRALDVYQETQTQVKETIRDSNLANAGNGLASQARSNLISQAYSSGADGGAAGSAATVQPATSRAVDAAS